jgi:hypothetical protein
MTAGPVGRAAAGEAAVSAATAPSGRAPRVMVAARGAVAAAPGRVARPPLRLALLGLVATALLLNLPTRWRDLAEAAAWALPLELLLAGFVVLVMPGRWRPAVASGLAAAVTALAVLRLADWGLWRIFGRPLTIASDLTLLPSLLEVVRGSIGWAGLVLAVVILVPALGLVQRVVGLPLRWLAGVRSRGRALVALAAVVVVPAGLQTAARVAGERTTLLSSHGLAQVRTQLTRWAESREAAVLWAREAAQDPLAGWSDARLFAGLERTDVIVVFVESYGRFALTGAPGAAGLREHLATAATALAGQGIASASGWLISPTVGGQSWLAHATVASGVWTDNQASYRRYLEAGREDLAHLFARKGHATILVAPAWVHPFPEAARLGFSTILSAAELGYRGPAFDFVNIPDQFTLHAFERLAARRAKAEPTPVYAQIALVGSHAPFTPVPPYLADWDGLGDGSVLASLPVSGEPAELVWREPERIRAAYAQTIDRTLRLLLDYAARHVDARTLLILIGDHEPAAVVTGDPDARIVPIHLLSADPALLRGRLAQGFSPGLVPDPHLPARRMDTLRSWLADGSGDPTPGDLARLGP